MMSVSVFAGDVPEALLSQDGAKVFIGTVESFTLESASGYSSQAIVKTAAVTPTVSIKGDVEVGKTEAYNRCDFGSFIPQKDTEYLFGYIDENNFYIYEIESRDEKTIKLVDSDKYDMTKRLEDYLNEGAFARAEQERSTLGEQISFLEYLYKKPSFSSSSVEKVTLRYQDELYEVDKDKFFQIAEDIMVTNVKNEPLHDTVAKPKQPDPYKTSLYIELLDVNDKTVYYGAVSRFGEVDRYSLMMSRLMAKDYEMKTEDVSKLYSLLSDEAQKNYTGWVTGGVATVFVIAFAVGYIVRKRKQKFI